MSSAPPATASRLDLLRFLSLRFVLILPFFVAAVGLTFYITVRTQYLDDAGRRATALAHYMNAELAPEIVAAGGRVLPPDKWTEGSRGLRVNKLIRRNLRPNDVAAITLYSRDGRILYSTAQARRVTRNRELFDLALSGEPRWRVEGAAIEPGAAAANPLAAYVPMYNFPDYPESSEIIGVFEIHLSLDATRANLRAFGWLVLAGSLGILLALFAILTMVARQASTLVQSERAAQQRLENELALTVAELEERVIQRTADLSSERELLATILNEAPSAFVLLDDQASVLFKSRQFESLMEGRRHHDPGAQVDSVRGTAKERECSHCGQPESTCAARAAIRSGKPHTTVHASARRTGMRWLEHRAVPVSLEESTVRVVEMITDVTVQEESQQRLARASTLALTGELAATVVHEVRNAATSTKLLLQLWAEREPPDSKHGESLSAAMASVARMEVLAENLLRIGRRPDREWRQCDLVQLVRVAVELIRPETYRRDITLVLDSPTDPLPCRADSGMLTAALLNLLLNATQAMTDLPGGQRRQLSISVGTDVLAEDFQDARGYPYGPDFVDHAGDLTGQLRHGSPVVFVEVRDTGTGISAEDRERVFEPFYTTKPSGTGLGLPITSRILKQHGGTLLLTSEPGVGSCVRVVLPAGAGEIRDAPPSLRGR